MELRSYYSDTQPVTNLRLVPERQPDNRPDPSDFGAYLLELEQNLIRLGVKNYRRPPSDYGPDSETVRALRDYQLARYSYTDRSEGVFAAEREAIIADIPHTD